MIAWSAGDVWGDLKFIDTSLESIKGYSTIWEFIERSMDLSLMFLKHLKGFFVAWKSLLKALLHVLEGVKLSSGII